MLGIHPVVQDLAVVVHHLAGKGAIVVLMPDDHATERVEHLIGQQALVVPIHVAFPIDDPPTRRLFSVERAVPLNELSVTIEVLLPVRWSSSPARPVCPVFPAEAVSAQTPPM